MENLSIAIGKVTSLKQEPDYERLYLIAFPSVARFVKKMGGSLEEAKDIFQDALIILSEKTTEQNQEQICSAEFYLLGISKNIWYKKYSRTQLFMNTETMEALQVPDDFYPSVNQLRLLSLLEKSGQKCLNLLKNFYYDAVTLKEIQKHYGFASLRSATVQKYKCLSKLRDVIKSKSIAYEDFLE